MVFKGVVAPASGTALPAGRPLPALQLVANRPILCHALGELRSAGVRETALVIAASAVGEAQACIERDGPADMRVHCVPYGEDDTLEQALARAASFVGEQPCIVHAMDGLLARPLAPLAKLLRPRAPDLLTLVRRHAGEPDSIALATRRLLRLAGAAPAEHSIELVGVCMFGPGALQRAGASGWWPGRELDLVSFAERLVSDGGHLHVERVRDWQRYTGEAHDLLELNRLTLDALASELALAPSSEELVDEPPAATPSTPDTESRIEGCVAIEPSASVRSSVIVGPTVIGAHASVIDSYIGPYTSIGAGALIEGAEVERSIILPGASIMHVGGRLTSSVVGRHARVFRDFSLPRALRLNVCDGGEVALC